MIKKIPTDEKVNVKLLMLQNLEKVSTISKEILNICVGVQNELNPFTTKNTQLLDVQDKNKIRQLWNKLLTIKHNKKLSWSECLSDLVLIELTVKRFGKITKKVDNNVLKISKDIHELYKNEKTMAEFLKNNDNLRQKIFVRFERIYGSKQSAALLLSDFNCYKPKGALVVILKKFKMIEDLFKKLMLAPDKRITKYLHFCQSEAKTCQEKVRHASKKREFNKIFQNYIHGSKIDKSSVNLFCSKSRSEMQEILYAGKKSNEGGNVQRLDLGGLIYDISDNLAEISLTKQQELEFKAHQIIDEKKFQKKIDAYSQRLNFVAENVGYYSNKKKLMFFNKAPMKQIYTVNDKQLQDEQLIKKLNLELSNELNAANKFAFYYLLQGKGKKILFKIDSMIDDALRTAQSIQKQIFDDSFQNVEDILKKFKEIALKVNARLNSAKKKRVIDFYNMSIYLCKLEAKRLKLIDKSMDKNLKLLISKIENSKALQQKYMEIENSLSFAEEKIHQLFEFKEQVLQLNKCLKGNLKGIK